MRYLILTDIHGNWEALSAILNHIRRKRYDRVLFLGDAVGYGASPNQVLDWLRSLSPPAITIRGNHDRVAAGLDDGLYFNRHALRAAHWTAEHLDDRNHRYLRDLPEGPRMVDEVVGICHGSPVDEDEYIFSGHEARPAFDVLSTPVIFFGHTHVASLFALREDGSMEVRLLVGDNQVIDLEDGVKYLVNPGSVGQPRDRNYRAAYCLFDTKSRRIHHYRVSYPVERARRRIVRAGLPTVLGDRLLHGV
ncbi:MAG: metallophosphatase family protein [Thermoanaerobaculales bacterium]|nr:metallophosphatase family protein [Thermoanaerobaculales bacterium]